MVAPDAVEVRLLGRPAVRVGTEWCEPAPGKPSALLYYLAFQGGWVGRSDLVFLFWPDVPEQRARNNLRPMLWHLARAAHACGLERERSRVRWSVPTDVERFRSAIVARRWRRAWELGRNELLSGFTVAGVPEFDAWLEAERAEIRGVARAAGLRASAALTSVGEDRAAADVLAALHRADPLDEALARSYVSALVRCGARAEALATIDALRRQLDEEMGVAPEEATLELAEAVRRDRSSEGLAGSRRQTAASLERMEDADAMPVHVDPLVGRDDDVRDLVERLHDPTCRLLTLIGPGGVGKTRVAVRLASTLQERFRDGARFVDLTSVTTPEGLATAVAHGVGWRGMGAGDRRGAESGLVEHLRERAMLVLLDNAEHLAGAFGLVERLLAAAPGLKVVATSRVRLGLPAEWVVPLEGLRYPDEAQVRTGLDTLGAGAITRLPAAFGALDLFVMVARRVVPGVGTDPASLRSCARICAHLGGVPLALELAASWLRMLSLEEIEAELADGSDLLLETERSGSDRHASLRVVFDHSWSLLDASARHAMCALSVFSGGWSREAAWEVAGVGLPAMLGLLDASLVRREPSGRYAWHPQVGAFARAMADGVPDQRDAVAARHARHFLRLVARGERTRRQQAGGEQYGAVIADLANVHVAWRWAIARRDATLLADALPGLWWTCNATNRLRWFVELAREACEVASPRDLLFGRAHLGIGAAAAWTNPSRSGAAPPAELLKGLEVVEALGSQADVAFGRRYLGIAHANQARFEPARAEWRRAAELYRSLGDGEGQAQMLCNAAANAATFEDGLRSYRQALAVASEHGEPRPQATATSGVGWILISAEGATQEARAALEQAVTLHEGFRQFESSARLTLARLHLMAGRLDDAHDVASFELRKAQASGADDAPKEASAANALLGWVAFVRGDATAAAEACRRALVLPQGTPFAPSDALAWTVLARLALADGEPDEAAEALERARSALARAVKVTVLGSPWGDDTRRWIDVHLWVRLHACEVDLALARARRDEARRAAVEALRVAVASGQQPSAAMAVMAAARAYDAAGAGDLARALAERVVDHPSTPFEAACAAPLLGAGRSKRPARRSRLPAWLQRTRPGTATPLQVAGLVLAQP